MLRRFNKVIIVSVVAALLVTSCSLTGSNESKKDEPIEDSESKSSPVTERKAVSTNLEGDFSYEGAECEFDIPRNAQAECGWLEVPQHWDDLEDTDTIKLHTTVLTTKPTPEDKLKKTPEDIIATPTDTKPVVYLEGGPGGDALGTLELVFNDNWLDIAETRPVIMFSQRGSNFSEVDLECEEVTEYVFETLNQPDDGESLVPFEKCAKRLIEEGADFSAYNSDNSAKDVEALRASLGYETWNVAGISYGTRLAQSLMRLFPETLSAVVLDSVMPTNPTKSVTLVPKSAERAFNKMFEACLQDSECSTKYPDLENRFYAVRDKLQAKPVTFEATDFTTFENEDVLWDGNNFVVASFGGMYSAALIPFVPLLVSELEKDEYETANLFASVQLTNFNFVSTGMLNSMLCHDAYNLVSQEEYDEGQSNVPAINEAFEASEGSFEEIQELCDLFGEDQAIEADTKLVESAVPTILFAGEFDPITPPSYAEYVATGLSNSKLYRFPKVGHAALGDSCSTGIAIEFFDNPESFPSESCIKDMPDFEWDNPTLG